MGAFSDRMYATGLKLLKQYGQAIAAVRNVTSSYDPVTGQTTDGVAINYSGFGYPSNYNKFNIGNVLVQQDDILLILSSSTEPLVNDIFTINSKAYTALTIQKITAQGQNVVYRIQLRQ